jgi:hypothetical protein
MTAMNPLESAVTALCQELDIPTPAPDARARYELRVGDSILRLGPWGEREVVLEGPVLSLGDNASANWQVQQDILRQAMTWNLARLKGQARPEVLSFDEHENIIVLWRTWPSDERLTAAILRGAEEMLNEVEFWRNKIKAFAPQLLPS